MSELIVIGITGKAGAGKDTAANALVQYRDCHRVALADGVRSAFGDLSGPTGQLYKELTGDFTYRRALQLLGTEARQRTANQRLWISLLLCKTAYLAGLHPVRRTRFVVPDVRYPLEVAGLKAAIHRWGGVFGLLKVTRTHRLEIPESNHSSETAIDDLPYDRAVLNDSCKHNLGNVACKFFDAVANGDYSTPLPTMINAAHAATDDADVFDF